VKTLLSLAVLALVLDVGAAIGSPPAAPSGKGLFLLVRHAERLPTPSMSDDVGLTDAGKARAERLATMLARSNVKTIFVTRFRRTQETAKPTADRLGIAPTEESDTDELVAKLRAHTDETVLVVGHSDTVPDVIKAFGGPAVTIADDEFGTLFVLAPATGALTRLAY
jgi:broad specificity phosphatase PhoE